MINLMLKKLDSLSQILILGSIDIGMEPTIFITAKAPSQQ
jgi:hypothetical protein